MTASDERQLKQIIINKKDKELKDFLRRDKREEVLDIAMQQPLTCEQIEILSPRLSRYIIPQNQMRCKAHGLIFYNAEGIAGAGETARAMQEALNTHQFSTLVTSWTSFDHLEGLLEEQVRDAMIFSPVMMC